MKFLALALAVLTGFAALAFDAQSWLGKREVFTREAERLQAAYTNCQAKVSEPAEGVNVQIETFEDGSVKMVVSARKAQIFLDSDLIWAEGALVRKFDEEGQEAARIEAEHCLVDRSTKNGWIEGPGRLVFGKTVFTGADVFFSAPEGYVISRRQTAIETTDLKFGGAL